jgi:hypothetical protein
LKPSIEFDAATASAVRKLPVLARIFGSVSAILPAQSAARCVDVGENAQVGAAQRGSWIQHVTIRS